MPSFRRGGSDESAPPQKMVLEFMVLEGVDAGQQFTVDGPEVLIGRGKPKTGQTGAIFLHDTTISAEQAFVRVGSDGAILEHSKSATNPTIVNGRKIRRQKIEPGDRIQMGRVVIEVRQRKGIALSGLFSIDTQTEPLEVTAANSEARRVRPQSTPGDTSDLTAYRPPTPTDLPGQLVLLRGIPGMENEVFPLRAGSTTVGRSTSCDVSVPEPGISRQHCRIEFQSGRPVIFHLSATNSTCINGAPLTDSRDLQDGDEILLADQVVLRLRLGALDPETTTGDRATPQPAHRQRSLRQVMEEKIEHDRLIEEEFSVDGSFVDIDVVGSYRMKADAERPAHIIVSFERFRAFVESVINEFDGQVLNSNGDELMCFFESTLQAVRAASAVLQRLDEFNAVDNVLSSPFRFRIGIHTGQSLVDRARGVAYSAVLDVAGHLQKEADVDGLLISASTLQALPEGLPFESAGELPQEGIPTFRLTSPID